MGEVPERICHAREPLVGSCHHVEAHIYDIMRLEIIRHVALLVGYLLQKAVDKGSLICYDAMQLLVFQSANARCIIWHHHYSATA